MHFYLLLLHTDGIPTFIHPILLALEIGAPASLQYAQIWSQHPFLIPSPSDTSNHNLHPFQFKSIQINTRGKQSLPFLFPVSVSVSVIESCGIGTSSFQPILFNPLSRRVICIPCRFPLLIMLIALDIGCDMRFGRKGVPILWRFRRWYYDMRSDLFAEALYRLRSLRQFHV